MTHFWFVQLVDEKNYNTKIGIRQSFQ